MWYLAPLKGSLETLYIWTLAKKAVLNADDWLLAQNLNEEMAFRMAAQEDHVEIL